VTIDFNGGDSFTGVDHASALLESILLQINLPKSEAMGILEILIGYFKCFGQINSLCIFFILSVC